MKTDHLNAFIALLEEIGRAFAAAVRHGLHAIATMSWPALLVACVLLALAISIVPLAIFLFVCFMALKLVVAALVLGKRRAKDQPAHQMKDI